MSVETFQIKPEEWMNAISVTEAAAEHFARQLQKSAKHAIRISLKESGCTGFKYVIEEVDTPVEGDIEKALPNKVSVFIAPKDIAVLKGLEIDYAQEGVNRNLVMNNPNVKDACGCGESFSV